MEVAVYYNQIRRLSQVSNMTSPRVLSLIGAVLLATITPIQSLKTYYMDEQCRRYIYMQSGAIILQLTSASSYERKMKCATRVRSDQKDMDRIMVRVLDMDIGYPGTCDRDRLEIYDGEYAFSGNLTGRYGICGYGAPTKIYKTSSDWITFNFTSNLYVKRSGFRLLVTGFDDSGICLSSSHYKCDNRTCVDDDLKCDGYENCEDGSDEENCDQSEGRTVGIVIGCVAAVIVIVVVVIVLAVKRRRACTNGRFVGTNRRYRPAQPYTVYGSPIAGQYPVQNTMPPAIAGQYPARNTMPPAFNGQPSAQNTLPPAYTTLYNTPLPAQGEVSEREQK